MRHNVIMPMLGMSQDTGVIYKWFKNIGDSVREGEKLMEVETDKAVMEIESQNSGIINEILVESGIEVPVGEILAIIESDNKHSTVKNIKNEYTKKNEIKVVEKNEKININSDLKNEFQKNEDFKKNQEQLIIPIKNIDNNELNYKLLASPKAKKKAKQYGLDLEKKFQNTGSNKPIHYKDVLKIINSKKRKNKKIINLVYEFDEKPLIKFNNWLNGNLENSVCSSDILSVIISNCLKKYFFQDLNKSISLKVTKYSLSGVLIYYLKNADLLEFNSLEERKTDKNIQYDLHFLDISGLNLSRLEGIENDISIPQITAAKINYVDSKNKIESRISLSLKVLEKADQSGEKSSLTIANIINKIKDPKELIL